MKAQNPFETSFGEPDGPFLLSVTRNVISTYLQTRRTAIPASLLSDPRFKQKMGCFVTLKKDDSEKSLRGCIGFPEPVYELCMALTHAGIAAATEDPRFTPVKSAEMEHLLLEISLLTKPVEISLTDQRDLPTKIEVGKDGLVLRWSFGTGLLLPQVATEYDWSAEDFLCNLSMKAGAPPDQWLVPGTQVYRFRAQVFQENSPGGKVSMD
ncbi:MAG TPA: TIGR00296 family protein [Nitrososphaerales archaeon]|nr:TIGR00296 family protein [Nitrososphaerales archaeon]